MNEGLPKAANNNRTPETVERYSQEWEEMCEKIAMLGERLQETALKAKSASGSDMDELRNVTDFLLLANEVEKEVRKLTPRTQGGIS